VVLVIASFIKKKKNPKSPRDCEKRVPRPVINNNGRYSIRRIFRKSRIKRPRADTENRVIFIRITKRIARGWPVPAPFKWARYMVRRRYVIVNGILLKTELSYEFSGRLKRPRATPVNLITSTHPERNAYCLSSENRRTTRRLDVRGDCRCIVDVA